MSKWHICLFAIVVAMEFANAIPARSFNQKEAGDEPPILFKNKNEFINYRPEIYKLFESKPIYRFASGPAPKQHQSIHKPQQQKLFAPPNPSSMFPSFAYDLQPSVDKAGIIIINNYFFTPSHFVGPQSFEPLYAPPSQPVHRPSESDTPLQPKQESLHQEPSFKSLFEKPVPSPTPSQQPPLKRFDQDFCEKNNLNEGHHGDGGCKSYFYRCLPSGTFKYYCPKGLIFNEKNKHCDFKYNVRACLVTSAQTEIHSNALSLRKPTSTEALSDTHSSEHADSPTTTHASEEPIKIAVK